MDVIQEALEAAEFLGDEEAGVGHILAGGLGLGAGAMLALARAEREGGVDVSRLMGAVGSLVPHNFQSRSSTAVAPPAWGRLGSYPPWYNQFLRLGNFSMKRARFAPYVQSSTRQRRFGRHRRVMKFYRRSGGRAITRNPYNRFGAGELKYHPVHWFNDLIDEETFAQGGGLTGGLKLLNGISQGTTDQQRIGNRLEIESLEMRMRFKPAATSWDFPMNIRCILFCDRQSNGTEPQIGDLLRAESGATFTMGMRNLDNRARFVIIRDWTYHIQPFDTVAQTVPVNSGTATYTLDFNKRYGVTKNFHYFKSFRKGMGPRAIHVPTFNNTSGVSADIASCALWLATFTDAIAGTYVQDGQVRLRFRG